MDKRKIPIIIGPTAIGKTKYAIDLSLELGAEIISADSMQVYKYMNIGTAKPSHEEQKRVPHHLIDTIYPDAEWNMSLFQKETNKLLKKNSKYVIVGGTGLYIKSLIYNYGTTDIKADKQVRDKYNMLAENEGISKLHELLSEIDPKAASNITVNDKFRLVRALELYDITGKIPSSLKTQDESYAANFKLICLSADRPHIYNNINLRVDQMVKNGLFEEVESLMNMGYSKDLSSMQALGYKESIDYIENRMSKLDCIDKIKQKTRNFAKRQLTWYRSFKDVKWIDIETLK